MNKQPTIWKQLYPSIICVFLLAGCAHVKAPQDGPPQVDPESLRNIPDATPIDEPLSKYGNPPSYTVFGETYYVMSEAAGYSEEGIASWYGKKFHGQRTSSGEPYDMYAMTGAHKTLPIPSYVRITNLDNQLSAVIRVNDRGPFKEGRIIDLSYAAAAKLRVTETGTSRVKLTVLSSPDRSPTTAKTTPVEPNGQIITNVDTAIKPTSASVEQSTPVPIPVSTVSSNPVRTNLEPAPPIKAGNYYLQVGAFSERDNAERMQIRMRSENLSQSVTIHPLDTTIGRLYRVWLGPIDSIQDVDSLGQRLQNMGIATKRITID